MPEIRYACVHCGQCFIDKQLCIKHEKTCWCNPAIRSCNTCKHEKIPDYDRKTFDCKKMNKRVRYKTDCKGWEENYVR